MAIEDNISNLANLETLVNWNDGQSKDEIESELFRILFQIKNTVPYDRQTGGNFQNLEQAKNNDGTELQLAKDIVLSVYLLNQSRNNNPYIVIGFSDVKIMRDAKNFIVTVFWRKLQDLTIGGQVDAKI